MFWNWLTIGNDYAVVDDGFNSHAIIYRKSGKALKTPTCPQTSAKKYAFYNPEF